MVGRTCKVRSDRVDGSFWSGRGEHFGRPLVVSVRLATESGPLAEGDSALIISEDAEHMIYTVRKISNELTKISQKDMIHTLAIIESVGLAVILGIAALLIGLLVTIIKMYRKVDQGYALVRNGAGGTNVSFAGMVSVPIFHKLEIMDLRVQHLPLDRRGKDGLICRDNVRADISVGFYVRVNPHENDVKAVAKAVGCERASDLDKIRELFDAKFSEALKTAGKQFDFESLYTDRIDFRNKIIEVIGQDLNGYALEDVAIDYLEQTPLEAMNPDNILDSEGIKKITERTAAQAILENEIQNRRIRTIKQNDVQRVEAVLELEKQQAEAEEKQKREVSVIRSREEAEAKRVAEEQRLRAEQAHINTEEELQIATQNMERQVIAEKNKQRLKQLKLSVLSVIANWKSSNVIR